MKGKNRSGEKVNKNQAISSGGVRLLVGGFMYVGVKGFCFALLYAVSAKPF